MSNQDVLDFNEMIPDDKKQMNTALLVAFGALCLQTWLMVADRHMWHWHKWDDWWTFNINDPFVFGIGILFGIVFYAAYLFFFAKLYKLYKQEIHKVTFFASMAIGGLLPIVPIIHDVTIPMDLSRFITIIAAGFGVLIIHRALLVFSLSKIISKTSKTLILLSAVFLAVVMTFLIVLQIAFFSIPPIAGYSPIVELGVDIYYLNQTGGPIDLVLTNVVLIMDLVAFSTIMVFTFWNALGRFSGNPLSKEQK